MSGIMLARVISYLSCSFVVKHGGRVSGTSLLAFVPKTFATMAVTCALRQPGTPRKK